MDVVKKNVMVESLLFKGAGVGAGAGKENTRSRPKTEHWLAEREGSLHW